MPKYYCDYCDTFLTHDSPSVRKTHSIGRKHKENVRDYYQKWMEEQAQRLIDQTTAAFKTGKIAPNAPFGPRLGMPPPMMGMPPRMMIPPPAGVPPMMNPMFMRPPPPGMLPSGVIPSLIPPPFAPITQSSTTSTASSIPFIPPPPPPSTTA